MRFKNQALNAAVLKLTAWYVGIIMLLSICFSMAFYQIYRQELESNLKQSVLGQRLTPLNSLEYEVLHNRQLDISLAHIRSDLFSLNFLMLITSSAVSYFLAKKSLQPVADTIDAQARFTADASHELRTPLTAMQTEIEVTLRSRELTKDQAVDQLKSNLEEIAKLRSLSEGLLQLAQADSKKMIMKSLDISKVLAQSKKSLRLAAKHKKIDVKIKSKPQIIKGNRQSLTELFAILLDNSIKYSPEGSTVWIESLIDANNVKVMVTDKGSGINADALPHIFDRFYRADSSRTKNKTSGYGLGLAIASQIAKAHSGSIDVVSAVGEGTTFTVVLPLRSAS